MNNEERIFRIEEHAVDVDDFSADGLILDIGGGGEGVIGQLKGTQVVAIDMISRELKNSPTGPLKIVMDARGMKFLDASFSTATAFFAFMFIHPDDHAKVFQEVFRVLAPGGQFLLWDIEIRPRPNPQRDLLVVKLQITLPTTIIDAGYGTPYTENHLTAEDYVARARNAGFTGISLTRVGSSFFCRLQKPE